MIPIKRQSIPRIGKVTLKQAGTATIHPLPVASYDDNRGTLIKHARIIAKSFYPDEMAGFVMIAWNETGQHSIGYRINDEAGVSAALAPSFVHDALQRDLIEQGLIFGPPTS